MKLIDKEKCMEFVYSVNKPMFVDEISIHILDQIIHDIDNEPTIDAIPIDWIRKEQNRLIKSNNVENVKIAEWLNGMVYRWRKDNE